MSKTLWLCLILILFLAACAAQPQGPQSTPQGSAIVWERSGGIAGICQRLTIEWNGAYQLEDCSDQSLIREGSLPPDQWGGLERLLTQYGAFEYENIPPQGSADMFTDQYTFNGTGSAIPSMEQKAEINEQLAQLATELAV